MKTILLISVRIASIPILLLLLAGSIRAFLDSLPPMSQERLEEWAIHPFFIAFFAGLGSRCILFLFFRRLKHTNPMSFIDTLEHELTHALFGYLTFSPPVSLLATLESGGEVKLGRRNIVVALAPYFFPLWSALLLGVSLLARENLEHAFHLMSYFMLGNFIYRLGAELRWYQNDFKIYGRLLSFFFFSCLLFFNFGAIFHFTRVASLGWAGRILPELVRLGKLFS